MKKCLVLAAVLLLAALLPACGIITGISYCDVDGTTYKMSDIVADDGELLAKAAMEYESAGSTVNYRGDSGDGTGYTVEFGTLTGIRGLYEVSAPAATTLSFQCRMDSSKGTCKLVVASDDGTLHTVAQGSINGLVEVTVPAGISRVTLAGDNAGGSISFGEPGVEDPDADITALWAGGFLGDDFMEEGMAESPV